MKTLYLFVVFFLIFQINLSAIGLVNETTVRDFHASELLEGNFQLRVMNNGCFGSADSEPKWPSLSWPINSDIDYLYIGTIWVGAKKHRRDELNRKMYWLHWPPEGEDDIIAEGEDGWSPDLMVIVDTLTSAGFDGDGNIFELLPAYNPLETGLGQQYALYNTFDVPVNVIGCLAQNDDDGDGQIDEDGLGSPFIYPDPLELYCFNKPYDDDNDGLLDEDDDMPGFQSIRTILYDFSPFLSDNSDLDRDYGTSSNSNTHVPLNVVVFNEYYAWPVEEFANCIVNRLTLYNASELDTLYDLCLGYYLDSDIGPQSWGGTEIASGDISRYIPDQGIAYSYDVDSDGGLSPGKLGFKILHEENINTDCWTWSVGTGPDDSDPLNYFNTGSRPTANQKYWLITGRNADPGINSHYLSLYNEPDSQLEDYPYGVDTRFLYAIYGDQQGYDNPTEQSINLNPGETKEFFSVMIMGYNEEELIEKVSLIEDFIDTDFDYSQFTDLKSIPFLFPVQQQTGSTVLLNWVMLTPPDEFNIYWKQTDEPASAWQYVDTDHTENEFIITDLEVNNEYEFKLGCLFDEVYLESQIRTIYMQEGVYSNDSEIPVKGFLHKNYPNPFNPRTIICFDLSNALDVTLEIYNIKGQKIKTLANKLLQSGNHTYIWGGTDDDNQPVSSGIYLYKLRAGKELQTKKMILLR